MGTQDRTPYQENIIKRYYKNFDGIQTERLGDLVADLYLATGKKQERLWKQVGEILTRLELPAARVEHLLAKRDPALLPPVLKEIESRRGSNPPGRG